jgi:hypothetical protein
VVSFIFCNLILGSAFVVCATAKHELGRVVVKWGNFLLFKRFHKHFETLKKSLEVFEKDKKRRKIERDTARQTFDLVGY